MPHPPPRRPSMPTLWLTPKPKSYHLPQGFHQICSSMTLQRPPMARTTAIDNRMAPPIAKSSRVAALNTRFDNGIPLLLTPFSTIRACAPRRARPPRLEVRERGERERVPPPPSLTVARVVLATASDSGEAGSRCGGGGE
jgi:hypothetical protein